MFTEPQEQTGSDMETMPIEPPRRDKRPIADREDKWRLYHRVHRDGTTHWYAYQPKDIHEPMFKAQNRFNEATIGGNYGIGPMSRADAIHHLQLAMAKARA